MPNKRPSVKNLAKKGQRPAGGNWSPEGRLRIGLNGFTLTGAKVDGNWKFECKDFPAIERLVDFCSAINTFFSLAIGETEISEGSS